MLETRHWVDTDEETVKAQEVIEKGTVRHRIKRFSASETDQKKETPKKTLSQRVQSMLRINLAKPEMRFSFRHKKNEAALGESREITLEEKVTADPDLPTKIQEDKPLSPSHIPSCSNENLIDIGFIDEEIATELQDQVDSPTIERSIPIEILQPEKVIPIKVLQPPENLNHEGNAPSSLDILRSLFPPANPDSDVSSNTLCDEDLELTSSNTSGSEKVNPNESDIDESAITTVAEDFDFVHDGSVSLLESDRKVLENIQNIVAQEIFQEVQKDLLNSAQFVTMSRSKLKDIADNSASMSHAKSMPSLNYDSSLPRTLKGKYRAILQELKPRIRPIIYDALTSALLNWSRSELDLMQVNNDSSKLKREVVKHQKEELEQQVSLRRPLRRSRSLVSAKRFSRDSDPNSSFTIGKTEASKVSLLCQCQL